MAAWTLTATGKLFHSGLPQHAINPIELVSEALAEMQRRFYAQFPPHPREAEYGFANSSSMKPTQARAAGGCTRGMSLARAAAAADGDAARVRQVSYPGGSVNQIPGACSISGDVRITPFYSVTDVMAAIDGYVADINGNLGALPTRGPMSKYELPDEGLRGKLELTWGEGFTQGIACDLASPGFAAMKRAFTAATGRCEPMAITGSLPCIKDLQDAGFDVHTMGFGLMRTYHANDEWASLADLREGYTVVAHLVAALGMEAPAEAAPKRARA